MTLRKQVGTVKFWFPITAAFADADGSLELKAPEHQNTIRLARNQTQHRTRSGSLQIYDRGIDFNNILQLQFRDMTDTERSNLVSFLSAVQWGSTKLAYQDMYEDIFYVRCATTAIVYTDTGLSNRDVPTGSEILWNFNVDFIDISSNSSDLATPDPAMSSALYLHLTDYNDPHAPESITSIGVETKVIESVLSRDWKLLIFWVCEEKGATKRNHKLVTVMCDGDSVSVAATNASSTESPIDSLGGAPGVITYAANLTGAVWGTQTLELKATGTDAGWTIRARRMKLK